jgi:eukaryotic-like serine/threonine-protein kinase
MTVNLPPSGEAAPPIYNGRYELRNQIARGGTAQVYLARDLLLDRPVALKVLFPELSSDSSFVERFRREAQAAANLSHPNIVPVFDWGESDRTYFIVMEHIDGEPLSSIIRNQAPLPAMRAAAIGGDIAKALSYAHRHGVVHRDVKPGNVLITRDGQVKVADFGIARAVGSDDSVTQTGLVMGTATYFSPEQAQGLGVDGRSDVYSLGVVLYEMVTGRAPFVADTPVAIAYKHVSEAPIPPRELEPGLAAPFEAIIMRAMAKNPADRYATAEDLHADLQRFMQGATVLAPLVSGSMATGAIAGGTLTALQAPVGGATTVALGGLAAGAGGAGGGGTTGQQVLENGRGPGGPPTAPTMPRRRWIPWAIAGIVLLAALVPLAIYGAHQLGYLGGKGYLYMPKVVGQPLKSAEATLREDGLVPVATAQENKRAANTVLSTNPARGQQVRKGSVVEVFYSSGPGNVPVPDVIGDSLKRAKAEMTNAHLKYRLATVKPAVNQATNIVTATNPQANTPVKPDSTVTITYTSGLAQVEVPTGLSGDTVAVASQKILNARLTVGTEIQQLSSTIASGSVIGTSPKGGSALPENSPVSLIVSEGPGVTVPPVQGQALGAAEQALHAAGLSWKVFLVPSSAAQRNIVITATPTGLVPSGTTITLNVGEGPQASVTVTNPGPQNSPANTAIAPLQITANDSAGNTLTFSATGLPAGLSISTTGMITGMPTQVGPNSVTVTALDSTGVSASTTFQWTITPGPGGGSQIIPRMTQSAGLSAATFRARRAAVVG